MKQALSIIISLILSGHIYSQEIVSIPKLEALIVLDGISDEKAWARIHPANPERLFSLNHDDMER